MKYRDHSLLFSATITLTFIGSSIATLTYWFSAVFYSQAKEVIQRYTNSFSLENVSSIFFVLLGALYFLSFIGAVKMWHKQKTGYFFYVLAQTSILIIPIIWLGVNAFSSTNLIFTLIFTGIYTTYLKQLG